MAKKKKNKKNKSKEKNPLISADSETTLDVSAESSADATEKTEAVKASAEATVEPEETKEKTQKELANEEAMANRDLSFEQLMKNIEALVFASRDPLPTRKLNSILVPLGFEKEDIKSAIDVLKEKYETIGIQFIKIGQGHAFVTNPDQKEALSKLAEEKPAKISKSAMELLAIIAYKQPITRAEIDAVRGTDSGHLLKGVLEKNLIRIAGHKETAGRPMLYSTTDYFLDTFKLASLDELPALEEFQSDMQDDELSQALAMAPDISPLAADPDRGSYDEPANEDVEEADFFSADPEENVDSSPVEATP